MNLSRNYKMGFTLIELMITVAIIGILAVIAIPKFAELTRKARESRTKSHLGTLRSALSVYYANNDGIYPSDHLQSLAYGEKYLKEIPLANAYPHHDDNQTVENNDEWGGAAIYTVDNGRWIYFNNQAFVGFGPGQVGDIWLGCSHPDSNNRVWSQY